MTIISKYSAFQGLYALTLAVCLVTASAQPILPVLPAGVTAAFTTAGGLVFTQTTAAGGVAAGTVLATIPTANLILGKAAIGATIAGKALLVKAILDEREKNQKAKTAVVRPHRKH